MNYDGYLGWRKPIPKEVKRAMTSFRAQKERCYNKNSAKYPSYGGAGIKIEYSQREFVWWLKNIAKRDSWTSPTVGRIDHTKGYYFDNIRLEERSENSKERHRRNPQNVTWGKKRVIAYRRFEKIEFDSMGQAAKYFNVSASVITRFCKDRQLKDGFTFKYEDA